MLYICIEGIIGSGKTSMTEAAYRALSDTHSAVVLKERFSENILLQLFYRSPKKYSILTEYSFLIDRFHQLYQHFEKHRDKITVADFSFRKCLWFARSNLTERQYAEYEKHYFQLEQDLNIRPTVLIFLDVLPQQALKNIQNRGREMERTISLEYLEELYATYKEQLKTLEIPYVLVEVKNYEDATKAVLEVCRDVLNRQENK